MFNALKHRLSRLTGRGGALPPAASQPGNAVVGLHLPNPYGGRPWLSATFALTSTPHGQGDTLRLRAHIDGCIRIPSGVDAAALSHSADKRRSLIARGQSMAAGAVRGVVDRLPAERLAPLTGRRWRSWIDVQVSTSPLDRGADALVPERLRALYGNGLPRVARGEPRIGLWSGPAGGPVGGKASLALLQLDENDLPRVRGRGPGQGFNLNASVAQVVEPDAESTE